MKAHHYFLAATSLLTACQNKESKEPDKPNILWIILDDTGCDFSCYGNKIMKTPVVDQLATEGILFANAHVTSPVSSPARSALLTGMYPSTIGAHNHRSSRGMSKIFADSSIIPIPALFREAGYYTANTGYDYEAKTDYNLVWCPSIYDDLFRIPGNPAKWKAPWANRKPGQPFFVQIQLQGGKNRHTKPSHPVDPSKVRMAPYYPNDTLFLTDQESYHNSTLYADSLIGNIMRHLREDGLDKNTIVMVLGDNGQDNYRDKQYLYDGGTKVPFIIWGPEKYLGKTGVVRQDLTVHIDMCATSLYFAGIPIPEYLEGRPLFGPDYRERDHIITARDRCDWTKDHIRAVRTKQFKYIRNYHPEYSYMQSQYRDGWPMVLKAKELYAKGLLTPEQARFFEPTRPAEEFYVLADDPWEINNQINNPAYRAEIDKLRATLDSWISQTGDKGMIAEPEGEYLEACRHVNTPDTLFFPVVTGATALVLNDSTGRYECSVLVQNTSNKTLGIMMKLQATKNLSLNRTNQSLNLNPGEKAWLSFNASASDVHTADSVQCTISATYEFNSRLTHTYEYGYMLKPQKRLVVASGRATADGSISEWGELPFRFDDATFGLRADERYVYIAVAVADATVQSREGLNPWQQDGLEIRLDARPDPARSSSQGTDDFIDHLLLAFSPSASGKPVAYYLPGQAFRALGESFLRNEIKIATKTNTGGYVAELAIPQSYLNNLQAANWDAFRLNIIVHDADGGTQRRYLWQPAWGTSSDYVGSGTFFRR